MGAGKIVGGILAIAGAAIILISNLWIIVVGSISLIYIDNIIISSVIIVGAILGLTGKKAGGWMALAGGLVWLLGLLLSLFADFYYFTPFSIMFMVIPVIYVYFGIIEICLVIVGAILILASGE